VLGLLLLVIALIVYGSLYPWDFHFDRHVDAAWLLLHNWPRGSTRSIVLDVVLNILLYVPVGVFALLEMARRRDAGAPSRARQSGRFGMVVAAAVLGLALSAAMELLQAYDARRDTSPSDLITNTAGAAAGALLALIFRPALVSLVRRGARRSVAATVMLAVFWTGFQLYPLFPSFRSVRLHDGLAFLAHRPPLRPVEIWAVAAEWFAIWLLLETFDWPVRDLWMAATLMVLPLRIFIPRQTVSWDDVLGAALALGLWWGSAPRRRLGRGAWILASAILLRELAPFQFSSHAAPFSWAPFYATLASERHGAVVVLLRKAFDYGAAVWALHAIGWSYARAGGSVAAALFGLELVQVYLPGRTPESTDPLLALLMALALWLASDYSSRRAMVRR